MPLTLLSDVRYQEEIRWIELPGPVVYEEEEHEEIVQGEPEMYHIMQPIEVDPRGDMKTSAEKTKVEVLRPRIKEVIQEIPGLEYVLDDNGDIWTKKEYIRLNPFAELEEISEDEVPTQEYIDCYLQRTGKTI